MPDNYLSKLGVVSKVILPFVVFLFLFFSTAKSAYAQLCPPGWESLCVDIGSKNIIGNIVVVIIILAAVISLIFLIIGGIRWITSGGDQAKIARARATLIAAIIGLAIACLTFFIVEVIIRVFTGTDLGAFTIPTLAP